MALGLKQWIGLVVLGMLVVGTWGLPPESRLRRRSSDATPERRAFTQLNRELVRQNALLKRVRWLESLDAAFEETEKVAAGVAVGIPSEAPAAAPLKEAVSRQVRAAGLEGPGRVRVGVFVVDVDQGAHPGVRQRALYDERQYFAFESQKGPACLVVIPVRDPTRVDLRDLFRSMRMSRGETPEAPEILGPCAFYHRHGTAGPEIRSWMASTDLDFAETTTTSRPGSRQGLPDYYRPSRQFWGFFGMDFVRFVGVSIGAQACLSGSEIHCAEVVRSGDRRSGGTTTRDWIRHQGVPLLGVGVGGLSWNWSRGPFGGYESSLLADVEAEFGQDRFREFWTSDAPLEEAFQAGFGQPLGQWVMSWAQARLGTDERGPALKAGTLLLSLLLIGACAGGGIWVVRRRTVG